GDAAERELHRFGRLRGTRVIGRPEISTVKGQAVGIGLRAGALEHVGAVSRVDTVDVAPGAAVDAAVEISAVPGEAGSVVRNLIGGDDRPGVRLSRALLEK